MKWIKGHTSELDSTLYQEADIEIRYVFYALRLIAGREDRGGKIKYLNNEHLARLINTNPEIIEKSLNYLQKTFRIKIHRFSEGYMLKIVKWNIYQGDTRKKEESRNPQKDEKWKADSPPRVEESRLEKKRVEKSEDQDAGEAHFQTRFEFLKRLRIIEEELEQETDNSRNERLFDFLLKRYRSIDPIRELDAIRELFKENPGEVKERIEAGKSLTDQLYALFENAAKYAGLKE